MRSPALTRSHDASSYRAIDAVFTNDGQHLLPESLEPTFASGSNQIAPRPVDQLLEGLGQPVPVAQGPTIFQPLGRANLKQFSYGSF